MLNHTSGSEEKYPHDESVCIILAFKKTRQHEVSNNRLSQKQRAPFAFKEKPKRPLCIQYAPVKIKLLA